MLISPSRYTATLLRSSFIAKRAVCYQRSLFYCSGSPISRRFFSHRANQPDEYELRVGYAIAVLQEELPTFFYQGLQVHDIYSPRVVLSDPHYTRLSIKGKTAYLGVAEMLRWSLGCYFDKLDFDIIRIRVLPDQPNDGLSPPSPPPPPPSSLSSSSLSYLPTSLLSLASASVSTSASTLTSASASASPVRSVSSSNSSSSTMASLPSAHFMKDSLPPSPPDSLSLLAAGRQHQQRHYASIASSDITPLPLSPHILSNYGLSSSVSERPSLNVRHLEIRWQLRAQPHSFFFQQASEANIHQVEGVFVYTFDQQGYICEHKIQRIQPSPSRRILLMHSYVGRLRAFLEALRRRNEPELRPGLGCG